LDGYQSLSEAAWDGTNQIVVHFPGNPDPETELRVTVHSSSVPCAGPELQTLWFGFCLEQWSVMPSNLFPNLQSFAFPSPRTNTVFEIERDTDRRPVSVSIFYSHRDHPYLMEALRYSGHWSSDDQWIPVDYTREIFARLGVEFQPGRLSVPTVGATYEQVLEAYRVVVSDHRGATAEDVRGSPLRGRALRVCDLRFGGQRFPLNYTASDAVPSTTTLRSDSQFGARIQQVEKARLIPDPPRREGAHGTRARVIVAALILGVTVLPVLLFFGRQARAKRTP
jgi:hypothetical protein